MEAHANRQALGFLGNEFVIRHESGFFMTTVGFDHRDLMLAFLRIMCHEFGCQVVSPNEEKVVTEEILLRLSSDH
jgi:hypothetical protein